MHCLFRKKLRKIIDYTVDDAGADGTVDVSPSARFCITEAEIVTALYIGIKKVMAAEQAA